MTQRIKTFERIGDELAEAIKSSGTTKRLRGLELARSFPGFRVQLLRMAQEQIVLRKSDPLIRLEDYFEDLFPEGVLSWKETRDILLFRIYEVLHEWLIENEYMPEKEDEEKE